MLHLYEINHVFIMKVFFGFAMKVFPVSICAQCMIFHTLSLNEPDNLLVIGKFLFPWSL